MACALTDSFALDCRDAIGGIKEIKVKKHPGLAQIETDFDAASGVVEITGDSLALWYTYGVEKETASLTSNANPSVTNGTNFYQQELKMILNKLSTKLNEELKLLARYTF